MKIVVEFISGTINPKEKTEQILGNHCIAVHGIAPVFDSADPDLSRFIRIEVDPADLVKAVSALSSAPEVVSAQPEPEAAIP